MPSPAGELGVSLPVGPHEAPIALHDDVLAVVEVHPYPGLAVGVLEQGFLIALAPILGAEPVVHQSFRIVVGGLLGEQRTRGITHGNEHAAGQAALAGVWHELR